MNNSAAVKPSDHSKWDPERSTVYVMDHAAFTLPTTNRWLRNSNQSLSPNPLCETETEKPKSGNRGQLRKTQLEANIL